MRAYMKTCETCGKPLNKGRMFCSRPCRRPSKATRKLLSDAHNRWYATHKSILVGRKLKPEHIANMLRVRAESRPIVGLEDFKNRLNDTTSIETAEIHVGKAGSVIIDKEDFDFLNQFSWHSQKRKKGNGWTITAFNRHGIFGDTRSVQLPTMIMFPPKGMQVDHHNGNTLDNRRCNLRVCTFTENQRNRGKNKNNKVGFKGVAPKRSVYSAQIHVGRKKLHLGTFSNPVEAAMAYDAAARRIHGEYAKTNF